MLFFLNISWKIFEVKSRELSIFSGSSDFGCGGLISKRSHIHSPNWPNTHDGVVNCHWLLHKDGCKAKITFKNVHWNHPCGAYVEIFNSNMYNADA